jgi:hypothetical protein
MKRFGVIRNNRHVVPALDGNDCFLGGLPVGLKVDKAVDATVGALLLAAVYRRFLCCGPSLLAVVRCIPDDKSSVIERLESGKEDLGLTDLECQQIIWGVD